MSHVNYRLELPTRWSIHPVFHIDLLTPYHKTLTHGPNYQRPPPELVDGEEEYEVKNILDSRHFGRGQRLQYLVKWKGYPDSENQWVNKADIHADEAIAEYNDSTSAGRIYIRSGRCEGESPSLLPPTYMTIPTEQTPLLTTPPITRPVTPEIISSTAHGFPTLSNPFCGPSAEPLAINADAPSTISSPFEGPFDDTPITLVPTSYSLDLTVHDPSEDMPEDEAERAAATAASAQDGDNDDHVRDMARYAIYATVCQMREGGISAERQEHLDQAAGGLRPITQEELDNLIDRFPGPPLTQLSHDDRQPERYISLQAAAVIRGSDAIGEEAENAALCAVLPSGYISPVPLPVRPRGTTIVAHGVCRGSNKTFIKPLYATASYDLTTRPRYLEEDLYVFGEARRQSTNLALKAEGDESLRAEVQRFCALEHKITRVQVRLRELEDILRQMLGSRHGTIHRLEMADAVNHIKERVGNRLRYGNPWDSTPMRWVPPVRRGRRN